MGKQSRYEHSFNAANPYHVQAITSVLIEAYMAYIASQPEETVRYIDGMMAVLNVAKVVVLHIQHEDDKDPTWLWNKMAVDIFIRMMERDGFDSQDPAIAAILGERWGFRVKGED